MKAFPRERAWAPADRERLAAWAAGSATLRIGAGQSSELAYLAWALEDLSPGPWVWVLEGAGSLELFAEDLAAFTDADEALILPARESGAPGLPGTPGSGGDRLRALVRLTQPPAPLLVATSLEALMQKTSPPRALLGATRVLRPGMEEDPRTLAAHLQSQGYDIQPEVHLPGQAAPRGGLLDVWPPSEDAPLRIEFFGDLIDSIRSFDPLDQTSTGRRTQATLPPAGETDVSGDVMNYFPPRTHWVWVHPSRFSAHAGLFGPEPGGPEPSGPEALRERVSARFSAASVELVEPGGPGPLWIPLEPGERAPGIAGGAFSPDLASAARERLIERLTEASAQGWEIHCFFDTSGSWERFRHSHPEVDHAPIQLHIAPLSAGFVYPERRLKAVAESDLYGFRRLRRARRTAARHERAASLAESGWTALQPDDLVVHTEHGLGRYRGMQDMRSAGRLQETLAVEYAGGAILYVPVAQAHLLSRYVGVGGSFPPLHRLGGRLWEKQKEAAREAVKDLAAVLLDTLAARETLEGRRFAEDTPWQKEFEAAFPYEETPDQAEAIAAVKRDMESPRPMDRLICGDVGYGKTEVAMRAAFKAVMGGCQVAVLTPTTVLAQQHYYTFSERMAAFPVRIEMLSRFRTEKEQREIVRALREGRIDIVIGTHRLVQPDLAFRDLGLVIIDEEQRFGVADKEALKRLRRLVDVLTLTATPIPRTLYLSLTGAKEMSTIQTAPLERLPIETAMVEYSDALVHDAIRRELRRDGQVFYLHNRVQTIERVHGKLKRLVPEASLAVAHGRMSEHDLAGVMRRFTAGEIDVLLCTTIIESGVDIPNVNTMLIDRADRFGLADLYQLRGRVGRTARRAYAYFLIPPRNLLPDAARKRLDAIRQHQRLGAGFQIALRDLEIRGAGNLLGSEQSGHIAAVGFDLYCQLLRAAVARLKGETPPAVIDVELRLPFIGSTPSQPDDPSSATIPYGLIEDENQRLEAYRALASASRLDEVDALAEAWRDRYGPLPPAVLRLLDLARLRIAAAQRGIESIEVRQDKLMIMRAGEYLMPGGRFPRLREQDPGARLKEIIAQISAADWA